MLTLCESSGASQCTDDAGAGHVRWCTTSSSRRTAEGGLPPRGGRERQGHDVRLEGPDVLTAINKELCLRVFAAALRCSNRRLHQLAVVCRRASAPLEMMVNELSRTAEIKPTLGYGAVCAKNSFTRGASDIYKISSPTTKSITQAS